MLCNARVQTDKAMLVLRVRRHDVHALLESRLERVGNFQAAADRLVPAECNSAAEAALAAGWRQMLLDSAALQRRRRVEDEKLLALLPLRTDVQAQAADPAQDVPGTGVPYLSVFAQLKSIHESADARSTRR